MFTLVLVYFNYEINEINLNALIHYNEMIYYSNLLVFSYYFAYLSINSSKTLNFEDFKAIFYSSK